MHDDGHSFWHQGLLLESKCYKWIDWYTFQFATKWKYPKCWHCHFFINSLPASQNTFVSNHPKQLNGEPTSHALPHCVVRAADHRVFPELMLARNLWEYQLITFESSDGYQCRWTHFIEFGTSSIWHKHNINHLSLNKLSDCSRV